MFLFLWFPHPPELMLPLLPIVSLAQTPPPPSPFLVAQIVTQPQEIRPLPGKLDAVPVFNSNSPEVVQTEGILLSTFYTLGKRSLFAHLNYSFDGRFDVFAHHIARPPKSRSSAPLYLGVIVFNPGDRPVKLDVLQAVSYLTFPDAPFIDLPPIVENPLGTVYSGPGSRLANDILRGVHQDFFPTQIEILPGKSQMLLNLPIPNSTGRSTLIRLNSNGRVYVASLAMHARPDSSKGKTSEIAYRAPTVEEWQNLLDNGTLVSPRDRPPTPPELIDKIPQIYYGRVAGVAMGSQWQATATDNSNTQDLSIPEAGKAFSYPISTVEDGTLGTNQVQSAPLAVRYSDTAYHAHGNYGVRYSLSLPLHNPTRDTQAVAVTVQTPLKEDEVKGGLRFVQSSPEEDPVFFRGTVQLSYKDDYGEEVTRYVHLVQRRGQMGEPLIGLNMPPGDRRLVKIDFLYPPDATPPQVVTVKTLDTKAP